MPQCRPLESYARFKHSQTLDADDVFRMKVNEGNAAVGFAGQHYDPDDEEYWDSTAFVYLEDGTTAIGPDLSPDGEQEYHRRHLKDHLPQIKPYDVALRCDKDGNVPQIQFNDGVWHNFTSDRTALTAGPWFPYIMMDDDNDRLSDLRVNSVDCV